MVKESNLRSSPHKSGVMITRQITAKKISSLNHNNFYLILKTYYDKNCQLF